MEAPDDPAHRSTTHHDRRRVSILPSREGRALINAKSDPDPAEGRPEPVLLPDDQQVPAAAGADEDDSLLERIADTVVEVFDAEPTPDEPEGPWERRQRILDSWTAIILGLAAVATAWASFQAGQWSDVQSDATSRSAILRNEAARATTEAGRTEVLDNTMWLAWLDAVADGDVQRATFLRERFSPQLSAAVLSWAGTSGATLETARDRIPDGTPFDQPDYQVQERTEANRLADEAEAQLVVAGDASTTATRYVLVAVVLALSLFFAGVATKFTSPKVQALLIVASIGLLVWTVIWMILLPNQI